MAPTRQEREAREARERLRVYTARQKVHDTRITRRRRDNILAIAGVLVIVGLAAATQVFYFTAGPGAPVAQPSASASPSASAAAGQNVGDVPDPSVAEDRDWTGTLTLNEVPLGITLDGAAAPQAVSVLVQAVEDNFYPGKYCPRLVDSDGFGILQCGTVDISTTSDTTFSYGPIENAPADGSYPAGTIAIARGNDAYSQGRQFFICFADTTLPTDTGGYTVVGQVTSGLDQLQTAIVSGGAAAADASGNTAPNVETKITAFTLK